jgi:KipI family sensor histidine kinase inhibitor
VSAGPQLLGEGCLVWTLGERIDEPTSARVLSAYRRARADVCGREAGVLDVVPAYASIAVYFDPLATDVPRLTARIAEILTHASAARGAAARRVLLRTRYEGEDLAHVARHAGLRIDDVVRVHAAPVYSVAMIGFRPHFPYLLGLDPRLATPRRATPRTRVPAGAVAIGGAQTGVYPCDSPGGWHVIGYTDPAALVSLAPGDRVVFEAVT